MFVFTLTMADGARRDTRATLGDIWSLYAKVSFTPQLEDAARPVSPRMALAKRMLTGNVCMAPGFTPRLKR
jgi:hypothetical protein